MTKFPKYTENKRKGNIGEAFVQYVLSSFCLVHQIDGSYDVGNDMICELIKDQYPTNLLFYVQVKYTKRKPKIKKETLEYWKGSPIPIYLFWVKDKAPNPVGEPRSFEGIFNDVEYKRYTPIMHNEVRHKNEKFNKYEKIKFLRDLIIDYIRCQYKKGFTPIIKPRDFLTFTDKMEIGFPQELYSIDLMSEYNEDILKNSWANLYSVAILLYKRNNEGDYKKAGKLIELGKSLFKNQNEYADNFAGLLREFIENVKRDKK